MLLRILQFPDIQEFLNIILDFITVSDYNNTIETNSLLPPNLMTVLYTQEQKKQVRVTLTLSVLSDFNARQIDWRKLFELEDNEDCEAYIEEDVI